MAISLKTIEQLFQKNSAAFEEIYNQTHKGIYALIFSYTKNHEITKDLMQDAYMKMLEKLHYYNPKQSFFVWFMQVAKNHTIDYLRKHNRIIVDEVIIDNQRSYEHATDEMSRVYFLLKDLDETSKQIVILKAIEDMSFKDIAEILKMKLPTVQWKYYEALKMIERSL